MTERRLDPHRLTFPVWFHFALINRTDSTKKMAPNFAKLLGQCQFGPGLEIGPVVDAQVLHLLRGLSADAMKALNRELFQEGFSLLWRAEAEPIGFVEV